MNYRDTARRLQALEVQADRQAATLYNDLLQSLRDDELDAYIETIGGIPEELRALSDYEVERRARQQKPTHHDYKNLWIWLEKRRAAFT